MKVMLDNSVLGHSQFAESRAIIKPLGDHHSVYLAGFVRRKKHQDSAYQREIDSLFTVGRLIREGHIHAFSYSELRFESWRGLIGVATFDALEGCLIADCDAPLERSRFFQTSRFDDYVSKGGKKDRKAGIDTSMSQIRFVEWILSLTAEQVRSLISLKDKLRMSVFEIESLHALPWFRTMCQAAQSPENFPDMLHLWAAQRNLMEVFLTLERRLPNIGTSFPAKATCRASFPTLVLRPLELLRRLGVAEPDPVPIQPKWFYPIAGEPFLLNDGDL